MVFSKDFKEFVELLHSNDVKYLVVGGYAVAIYGHPRFTGDIDIWIEPSVENSLKMINVFEEFGLSSFGLSSSDFIKPNFVIQIGQPPFRIDILTSVDGLKFEEAFINKNLRSIDGLEINFISLNDLKINKRITGRYKDLDDLENLN